MKDKIIFILMLTLCSAITFAQKKHSATPLFKFLKANADSTIVMSYESSWGINPVYFMLSKKGDTINAYTYKIAVVLDQRNVVPHNIQYRLYQNTQALADVNSNFYINYLSSDSLKNFWKEIVALKPWNINDDQTDGAGCPVEKDSLQRQIRDGSTIKLHLITKKEIKELSFYAPEYYEKQICPGRVGRQTILRIEKLFETYVQK
ncbi:hypothetical protein EZ456_02205 [Pedobacter psychrodurus]|uniref:GLPGLI family protein n=1 Tax=Pedobacter psychrodurus TaxID=2530456 RepID=A0A4R0Q3D2_9SPHI|nr:hypothetical protein [Pedobacter psychrodurus]TCD28994.1 hypothetical protein EZ456_02205 [Pedobacter psychrodurus]